MTTTSTAPAPLVLRPPLWARVMGVSPAILGFLALVFFVVLGGEPILIPVTIVCALLVQWMVLPYLRARVWETPEGLAVCNGGRTRLLPWEQIEAIEVAWFPVPATFGHQLERVAVRMQEGTILLLPVVHKVGAVSPPHAAVIDVRDQLREVLARRQGGPRSGTL